MAKIIEAKYEEKFQYNAKNLLTDEYIVLNGTSFNPVDLMASSYATCILGTIDYAARKNHFETLGSRAEILYGMTEDKTRVGTMTIKIFFENDYTEEQKQVIEFSAKNQCHVGNSLDPGIKKVYEFNYTQK